MLTIGFDKAWVDLIMRCVQSVRYFVVLNEEVRGTIIPSQGLQKGDSLSPFLFLFCSEGLASLLKLTCFIGLLKGVRASHGGPRVTHLFFANDSMIFGEALIESLK